MSTENPRLRRAKKSRAKMAELHVTRLTVYRSNSNIYAQIIDGNNNRVIATASTTEAEVKKTLKNTSNKDAAIAIGKRIA
ncbi:MAG: 50S ribosomal protein L18, partial [Nitrosomonadales bacterium]|nr:50S ribosomal protein L18 [Nitrosomonadales bacterium]